jgi:chromate reductase, NAD(P)H dehydrogenase (quinone)
VATTHVLALSGSLRAASINSAFCRAAAKLAPPGFETTVYAGLGALPLFNPDAEASPPESVLALRRAVSAADALVVASPEYAHGISGVMKNALDWLVSHEGAAYKPVALVNTSPRASHAVAALREVLTTMSAALIEDACISVPLLAECTTEDAMLASNLVRQCVVSMYAGIAAHLHGHAPPGARFVLS